MMTEQDMQPAVPAATNTDQARKQASAFPQFALDAADRQLEKIGGSLGGAADAIDGLFKNGDLPGGAELQRVAGDAARRMRSLGDRANTLDAEEMLGEVQRMAAARPALAVAVGALTGALLGLALTLTAPQEVSG